MAKVKKLGFATKVLLGMIMFGILGLIEGPSISCI